MIALCTHNCHHASREKGTNHMRAVLCTEWGGPEKLTVGDIASPSLGPTQIRIGVHACGLNFADTLMIQGLYQEKPPFPFSPGLEVAGEVVEVGAQVSQVQPGHRVIAICGHGGMAEEVAVDASAVLPIPPEMDFVTAAGFAVTYGTSHVALAHRARLQPGEVLLVHGAAGGVGLTAVQIGKRMGATVIATASTPEKLALAQQAGADHLINYAETPFRDRVREITNGSGADVIFDPVGGDVFSDSLRCINWEGRLLVIGFASGQIPQAPANLLLVKNISVVGLYWGAYAQRNPGVLMHSLETLFGWYKAGQFTPHISQLFQLEEAPAAFECLMQRRATGKLVIRVRDDHAQS